MNANCPGLRLSMPFATATRISSRRSARIFGTGTFAISLRRGREGSTNPLLSLRTCSCFFICLDSAMRAPRISERCCAAHFLSCSAWRLGSLSHRALASSRFMASKASFEITFPELSSTGR